MGGWGSPTLCKPVSLRTPDGSLHSNFYCQIVQIDIVIGKKVGVTDIMQASFIFLCDLAAYRGPEFPFCTYRLAALE